MAWIEAFERLMKQRIPFFRTSQREGPPSSDGWRELPVNPELFATFGEPLDTICPTPWNMLGLMIGNQFPEQEENNEDSTCTADSAAALH